MDINCHWTWRYPPVRSNCFYNLWCTDGQIDRCPLKECSLTWCFLEKINGDLICLKRLQIKLQIDGNASPDWREMTRPCLAHTGEFRGREAQVQSRQLALRVFHKGKGSWVKARTRSCCWTLRAYKGNRPKAGLNVLGPRAGESLSPAVHWGSAGAGAPGSKLSLKLGGRTCSCGEGEHPQVQARWTVGTSKWLFLSLYKELAKWKWWYLEIDSRSRSKNCDERLPRPPLFAVHHRQ